MRTPIPAQLGFSYVGNDSLARAVGSILPDQAFVLNSYHQSQFTLGTRLYEVYVSGVGAPTGAADVDIDVNAAVGFTTLVGLVAAGIMGDADREVNAYSGAADTLVISALTGGVAGNAIVFLETADPNNMWLVSGAGTLEGGQDAEEKETYSVLKTITTDEVTALAAGLSVGLGVIALAGTPYGYTVYVYSAAGILVDPTGIAPSLTTLGGGLYAAAVLDGVAALSNGDVLRIVWDAAV